MPDTIEAPAPPAAPAAPTTSAPAPEIHVTPGSVTDRGPAPPPPKPGSARDRMFQDLRKKAGVEEEATTKPAATDKKTIETKPVDDHTDTPADKGDATETAPATAPTTTTPEDRKKVSPWKLVDQYKNRVAELEKSVADAKTTGLAETEKKTLTERLTQAETRLKEYEEELRFTNYQKHPEFKDKYQKPYEEAWKKWMGELGELVVPTADGTERPIAPQDLLELVNMPLQKAREQANQVFGDFANDVMSARKEIRSLFDAQNKALEDARKSGSEREQKRAQDWQTQQEGMRKSITELWTKTNEEVAKNEQYGQYFRPVEGDTEGNERLKKGYELADRAFAVNPFDGRLTPDQRAEIVKLHAAVRNRCASFGRLTFQNQKLQDELKSMKDELNKFKSAQPGAGEGTPRSESTPRSGGGWEGMREALGKYVH